MIAPLSNLISTNLKSQNSIRASDPVEVARITTVREGESQFICTKFSEVEFERKLVVISKSISGEFTRKIFW